MRVPNEFLGRAGHTICTLRLDPELRFAVRMLNVNVRPSSLAGKGIRAETLSRAESSGSRGQQPSANGANVGVGLTETGR